MLPLNIIEIKIPDWAVYLSLGVALVGISLGLTAMFQLNTDLSPFPSPIKNGTLRINCAYSITRHPIYTSILLFTAAYAFSQGSIYKFLIFCMLYLLFHFKSKYEEKLLSKKFSRYQNYQLTTGRIFPRLKKLC